MLIDRRHFSHFDWGLFAIALVIPLFGLIALYSAGYHAEGKGVSIASLGVTFRSIAFVKQALFILVGVLIAVAALCVPVSFLHRVAYPFYGGCLLLLAFVLQFGVVRNSTRGWFDLGPVNFQPAELMKLAVVLCLARYLSRNPPPPGGYRLKHLIAPGLLFGIPMLLIMKQPDFGTSLVIGAVGAGMLMFLGIRPKLLLIFAAVAAIAVFPAWDKLREYQKRRIMVLFDPDVDPLGSGYNIIQSKIAVGSGGLVGKGFLQGTQSHLEFLPEHTTDFIFSVLAEEFGFIGCIFVLAMYAFFVFRMLRVVARGRDLFSSLVALGISIKVFFHVFVNISMVIGILPVVGIPLPLFSYGGSSMLSTMLSVGIVLGISMRRFSLIVKS